MLLLNRDSNDWKNEVYNEKGHQFVYFIRNHDSDSAKVGLHNRDIYALWQRYKTYYSSFDAYIVRVEDSKYIEKKLFSYYDTNNLRITNEMVKNNTMSRDIFKHVTSKYDLDNIGQKQTHNTAKLVNNYHDPKPIKYYKEEQKQRKNNYDPSYKNVKVNKITKMYVSDKLNSVKDTITDFFQFL